MQVDGRTAVPVDGRTDVPADGRTDVAGLVEGLWTVVLGFFTAEAPVDGLTCEEVDGRVTEVEGLLTDADGFDTDDDRDTVDDDRDTDEELTDLVPCLLVEEDD